jgi:hypothetical protein
LNFVLKHTILVSDYENHPITLTIDEEHKDGGLYIDMPYYYNPTGQFSMTFSPINFNDVGQHKFRVKAFDG